MVRDDREGEPGGQGGREHADSEDQDDGGDADQVGEEDLGEGSGFFAAKQAAAAFANGISEDDDGEGGADSGVDGEGLGAKGKQVAAKARNAASRRYSCRKNFIESLKCSGTQSTGYLWVWGRSMA